LPIETGSSSASKAKHSAAAERDPDNVVEDWSITMPADASARVVSGQQRPNEIGGLWAGKRCRSVAE